MNIESLEWDNFNKEHIKKHDVTPQEVEEAIQGEILVLQAKKGRFFIVGTTEENRALSIVLAPKHPQGTYYPVTARPASRKERKLFTEREEVEQVA